MTVLPAGYHIREVSYFEIKCFGSSVTILKFGEYLPKDTVVLFCIRTAHYNNNYKMPFKSLFTVPLVFIDLDILFYQCFAYFVNNIVVMFFSLFSGCIASPVI